MARTTELAVQKILLDHYDGKSDLDPFIATASALVDYAVGKDTAGLLSSTLRELIERYLAAHFYALADQIKQEEHRGKTGAVYQGQTGVGLKGTQYGQAALDLDVSGILATIGKRRPTLSWMGLPKSEQTEYEDRN